MPDQPSSAILLAFPARPDDRLRHALRNLEAALAEQSAAVAGLRTELAGLSGAVSGLELLGERLCRGAGPGRRRGGWDRADRPRAGRHRRRAAVRRKGLTRPAAPPIGSDSTRLWPPARHRRRMAENAGGKAMTHPLIPELRRARVVPVVRTSTAALAATACDWLREAGLSILEITLTIPDAPALIRELGGGARAC